MKGTKPYAVMERLFFVEIKTVPFIVYGKGLVVQQVHILNPFVEWIRKHT